MLLAANDNHDPITGAKSHSWPAMRLNAKDQASRALLALLSYLFELAAEPHNNLPSPASAYGADGDLSIAGLMDELPRDEDGKTIGNSGYGIDYCMRESTDMHDWDDLCVAGADGAYWTILPDGRKGGSHCPNFRVVHVWRTQLINGKVVKTALKESYAQYRSERRIEGKQKAVWINVGTEEFYRPRGPDPKADNAHNGSPAAVTPSESAGAVNRPFAPDNPIDARLVLERLRSAIGDENFEVLRLTVVNRRTARSIGEAMGKKYNAASALGTALIRKALQAANDNLPMLAEAA
ncbi:MAG: hypothetical protein WDN02_10265 [Methylovirgula sp.]|uniref:hypothetical protein n=1 Tax=Methylovirgula sp. TaxID=1978224 RepID=UPI0030761381